MSCGARCRPSGRCLGPSLDIAREFALRTYVRMPTPYVELHAHSAFSFLDGASTPIELANQAARLGYPTFALTDHDGLWGSMEFAQPAGASAPRRRSAPAGRCRCPSASPPR